MIHFYPKATMKMSSYCTVMYRKKLQTKIFFFTYFTHVVVVGGNIQALSQLKTCRHMGFFSLSFLDGKGYLEILLSECCGYRFLPVCS